MRLVVSVTVLIWILKLWIRPHLPVQGALKFFCGIAPNLMGAYLVPFAAYWLFTHSVLHRGQLLRFAFFSDTRIVCLTGLVMAVINEYLQRIPFFGRTFDYYDMLFSAVGLIISYYHFNRTQARCHYR